VTDFRELVGEDLSPEEEARLLRVHELLVAAGPPEELPPSLAEPPGRRRGGRVVPFPGPRRRLGAALVLAAALAAALFGGGYWVGAQKHAFKSEESFVMRGPGSSRAFASIKLAPPDSAFNWPLLVQARGLKDLPKGGYYELLLTKDGKPGPSCGTFRTHGGATKIVLNAPYSLKHWNGWIVVAHLPGHQPGSPVLTTHLA
jgi:hypothetical protein